MAAESLVLENSGTIEMEHIDQGIVNCCSEEAGSQYCRSARVPSGGHPFRNAPTLRRWRTAPIKRGATAAQLTIFYGGVVNVYDHVHVDQARAIMLLANTGNSGTNESAADFGHHSGPSNQTQELLHAGNDLRPPATTYNHLPQIQTSPADIRFIRKHSLLQFLERRKERLNSMAP